MKNDNTMKSWSITARLTVFTALATASMLLLITLFSHWALTSILDESNSQFMIDEIRVLRNLMMKHPKDRQSLEQEIDWIPEELSDSQYHYYARIYDEKRHVLMQTEGMNKLLQNAPFPEPVKADEWPDSGDLWVSPTGKQYLLMSAMASLGKENLRLIEMALDITPQKGILSEYQSKLFYVFIIGIIAACTLSALIARHAMRGLKDIAAHAERMTISKLSNRLNPADWPTELRQLVEAFNQMLARIDVAYSKLSQFSAELAHEFRTPLNNLIANSEIVLSRARSIDEYRECIASNLEDIQHLSRMMENLLFLAKSENPQADLVFQPIELAREFQMIAEFYDALAEDRKVTFQMDAEDITLRAEPLLLRRMLSNLVSNAIKFMPDGGAVKLSARKAAENTVVITVEDTGVGISTENIPNIFNRFYKVATRGATDMTGIGLGLAIVKSIVELHRGRIMVQSALGQGTRIEIVFPGVS